MAAPDTERGDHQDERPAEGEAQRLSAINRPTLGERESKLAVNGFHLIERLLLIIVALMTLGGATIEIVAIVRTMSISLADILLMFLYTEIIGMVAVFYAGSGTIFVYPIFIAITALSRLIILQGKEMAPENIVFEAGAILLLAIASVVIVRALKLPRGE